MTSTISSQLPVWLGAADELPHGVVDMQYWVENYLTYAYSPASQVGIYLHFRHVPGKLGKPDLWDELLQISLPGDRYLTSRAFGPGHLSKDEGRPGVGRFGVCGLSYECHEPFARWTKRFVGGARLITGDELRAGPVVEGPHVPVELELDIAGWGAPFDYGTSSLEQAWGKAHYEQHHRISGHLLVDGERYELDGTGLRDHSWGPREFAWMGRTTWIHASFPDSGRAFALCYVAESPPHVPEKLLWTVVHDTDGVVHPVEALNVPEATKLVHVNEDAEFGIRMPDGRLTTVRTTLLTPLRMHLMRGSEIGHGSPHPGGPHPHATHHYCPTFVTVEWDGERGHGYNERSVELI